MKLGDMWIESSIRLHSKVPGAENRSFSPDDEFLRVRRPQTLSTGAFFGIASVHFI